MLTTREELTLVNHIIRLDNAIRTSPPYNRPVYELDVIKKKLEEDIAFEEVGNVQSGGD